MEYEKFYEMIDKIPVVAKFWDKEKNNLNIEFFEQEID